MTLEWAGISCEQGLWQYIIRIAAVSGASSLVPLLAGNAGYMLTENLDRFQLHGAVGNVDPLMSQPIKNAEEFVKHFRSISQCQIDNDVLQSPPVVHLFGHYKNNHLMLRNIILLRMLQYVGSNCESFVDLFKMLSQAASWIYSHHDAHHFTSTSHTHNLCIKTGKTGDKPHRIVFVAASIGVRAGNFPLQNLTDAYIFKLVTIKDMV